jgi:hypothetical protein
MAFEMWAFFFKWIHGLIMDQRWAGLISLKRLKCVPRSFQLQVVPTNTSNQNINFDPIFISEFLKIFFFIQNSSKFVQSLINHAQFYGNFIYHFSLIKHQLFF